MIHLEHVQVTCDCVGCTEEIFIPLRWVYRSSMDTIGEYGAPFGHVENVLIDEGWKVIDGKHYCPDHGGEDAA